MNTKPIPALLALFAGFVTCVMSFMQQVDIVVFAKRFVIVCIIFFIIGMIARILIEVNFKDILYPAPEEEPADEESMENIESEGEPEDDLAEDDEEPAMEAEEDSDEAGDE